MTKTYYIDNNDNIDNNINDINDINDPYEYVAPDNSTNIEVDDDFYFYNFFTPFTLFTLSMCTIYGLCYVVNKIKSISDNARGGAHARRRAREVNENINIDSLNTLVVCNELPENNCSICLEEFKNEDLLKKLNCNHIFHKDCLGTWINNNTNKNNNTCPLCRRVLTV
jgi:hypothetical protein